MVCGRLPPRKQRVLGATRCSSASVAVKLRLSTLKTIGARVVPEERSLLKVSLNAPRTAQFARRQMQSKACRVLVEVFGGVQ